MKGRLPSKLLEIPRKGRTEGFNSKTMDGLIPLYANIQLLQSHASFPRNGNFQQPVSFRDDIQYLTAPSCGRSFIEALKTDIHNFKYKSSSLVSQEILPFIFWIRLYWTIFTVFVIAVVLYFVTLNLIF